jgi:hypothetical protein
MSDEGTIVQKQGEIVAVQPTKTGWTEIHLQEEGKQYPYKASTKIPAIIEAAEKALWAQAVLTAKEVDSGNPNPNRPGFNYINRTAMKVEVGGTMDVPAAAPANTSRNGGAARSNSTDRSIERQVILKEMVSHYPGLEKITREGWWALMASLDAFMVGGVPVSVTEVDPDDDVPF